MMSYDGEDMKCGVGGWYHHHHRHPDLVVGLGGVAVLLLTVLVKDEHGWTLAPS